MKKTFIIIFTVPDGDQAGVEYTHAIPVNAKDSVEAQTLVFNEFANSIFEGDEDEKEDLINSCDVKIEIELPILIDNLDSINLDNYTI